MSAAEEKEQEDKEGEQESFMSYLEKRTRGHRKKEETGSRRTLEVPPASDMDTFLTDLEERGKVRGEQEGAGGGEGEQEGAG